MSTARDLLKSSAARTGFMALSAAIAFFMMPFMIGHLGERWFGIWILVAGLVANSYLLDLGMATAVTRYVAKHLAVNDSRGANEVVNTCLAIYSVLACVIFVAALVIGMFAELFVSTPKDVTVIRAAIIILGLQYAAEFPFKAFAGIISSYVRYDLQMLSRILTLLLSTTLVVYFIGQGYGILSLALIMFGTEQISNFLYYRIAKHLFRDLTISRSFIRRGLVRELFTYSSWSFVIQMANQLRFRTDSIVIAWMIGASSVTYYAVGLRLVEYFVDFVNKATNMMTPVFTRYFFQKDFEEIRKKYLFLTRLNAVLALFGGGMIVILGKAFIVRWMGPSFASSYPVLVILMSAMIVEVIGNYSDNILYAISKHKVLAIVNAAEAVLNVGLSLALVKPLGIAGVALGTAIPLLFFRLFVLPRYAGRFIGLSVWRYYGSLVPVTAFTGVYLAIFAATARPFLQVPSYPAILAAGLLGAPLYVLAIPFVGFNAEEREQLRRVLPDRIQRWTAPVLGRKRAGPK